MGGERTFRESIIIKSSFFLASCGNGFNIVIVVESICIDCQVRSIASPDRIQAAAPIEGVGTDGHVRAIEPNRFQIGAGIKDAIPITVRLQTYITLKSDALKMGIICKRNLCDHDRQVFPHIVIIRKFDAEGGRNGNAGRIISILVIAIANNSVKVINAFAIP